MVRPVLFAIAVLQATASFGQFTYGNEWIDHDNQYWRFDVYADGAYRIDSAALATAGFPLGSVELDDLMLFGREKQVPIYIHGGEDGVLNGADYIEFIGRKNDGWIDTRMFASPQEHANPWYSLVNDTIHYFLTWDSDPNVQKERVLAYANPDLASYTAKPWVWGLANTIMSNFYWHGLDDGQYGYTSGLMIASEGYGGAPLFTEGPDVETTRLTLTPRAYIGPDAPLARVNVTVAAQSSASFGVPNHHLQIQRGAGFSITELDTIFTGSQVLRKSFQLPSSDLVNNLDLRFRVPHDLTTGLTATYRDFQAPANIHVRYPRDLVSIAAGPLDFWVPNVSGETVARVAIPTFTGTPVLYTGGDTTRRIEPTLAGPTWDALLPVDLDSATTHSFLFATQTVRVISGLSPVNGNGYFVDYSAVDPDSAVMIVAHRSLWNGATAYATYRATTALQPRPTILADIDELYDQFGGGVPKNAQAIRGWCKFALDTWTTQPQGLFLIGKSVVTNYGGGSFGDGFRNPVVPNNGAYERCLVPTYGWPPCDQCFTMGLNFDARRMDIPVGRLSAFAEQQVFDYLDKVNEFEHQPVDAWMKNVSHLSGGFNANEQELLAYSLRSLEPFADDNTSFGAQYWRFRKSSSSTFSTAAADSVRTLIEGGVSILNFLAHAYGEGFDITIDDPGNYEWNGKYPLVIGNSCYIGNIHFNIDLFSQSEDWTMRPNKGPIAFLASSDLGISSFLTQYDQYFYRSMASVNYGKTLGEHMKYSGLEFLSASNNTFTLGTVHGFTLEGDPMLVLNSPPDPDFVVRDQDLLFAPENVNADVDSFDVKLLVRNIGRIVQDTVAFKLQRSNPNLTAPQNFTTLLDQIGFSDTAYFRLPTLAFAGGQGVNTFTAEVDLNPDLIPELENNTNNVAHSTLFITSGDLLPTWPYDFAILPNSGPALRASTGDPLAPLRSYVFQIDTTDLFNSPMMEQTNISIAGGVVEWQPSSIYALDAQLDSMVYFWRCSIDSVGNGGYNWYERSFQHIPGKRGWGQAHYFQFKNNDFSSITYDRPERDFDLLVAPHDLQVWTGGFDYADDIGWSLDLNQVDFGGCGATSAWHVAVVDPYTYQWEGTRWIDNLATPPITYNPDNDFGNFNDLSVCRNRVKGYFVFFQNNPAEMQSFQDMITTGIPDGYHMIIYTWLFVDRTAMSASPEGTSALAYLEGLGMPAGTDSVPYICYYQKGMPGTFIDTIGAGLHSDIRLETSISSADANGFITTRDIGPALQWHGLYWNETPLNANDSTVIQLQGVSASGNVVELVDFQSPLDSIPDLSPYVDANMYPSLRIQGKYHDYDEPFPEPAQQERWQLLYDPVPECAIDPQLGYYQGLEGLAEGQNAKVAVAVHNISEFDMDSLLMAAWVLDQNNVRRLVHYDYHAPLPAGGAQFDTLYFSTLGFGGANTLIVEANPIDTVTDQYDQPEQYHFNNIAVWRFGVTVDDVNPLLDVTFDGIHILDGDIVSARPEIEFLLDDENTLRIMDSPQDTALFKVYLTRPGQTGEQIYFRNGLGDELMQFIPANGPENKARILYRPNLPTDGKYLLTVTAKDLSNNASGDNNYSITFEVINRTTITEVLNYPNPFTTSTRFVFTLTGSQIPTYMKIQILTITGKVVREIGLHELGPLRIGRNMTDYAWDGKDEFGDKLARGVYLYRVIAQMNGEDIEYRQTTASGYFHKGFGKMYLLQ